MAGRMTSRRLVKPLDAKGYWRKFQLIAAGGTSPAASAALLRSGAEDLAAGTAAAGIRAGARRRNDVSGNFVFGDGFNSHAEVSGNVVHALRSVLREGRSQKKKEACRDRQ